MLENIMNKFGYRKLSNTDKDILFFVNLAKENEHDVFIDYLKTKKKQKIYIRDGKKTIHKELLEE